MRLITIAMLLLLSISLNAQDMQKYLADTKAMVHEGKYKEALQRDIWFHDHALEHNAAMRGVRLSFALNDWKELANAYPPAMAALVTIRNNKTKQLVDGAGSPDLFADVVAINRTLGETTRTTDLFQLLAKNNPKTAQEYWPFIKGQLFAAKRYDIIRKYIGSSAVEFDVIKKRYDKMAEMYTTTLPTKATQLKPINDEIFVKQSVELIQFDIAVNDIKAAKEIQQKAMHTVKDDRLSDAIQKGKR